jgi:hypothetical protein
MEIALQERMRQGDKVGFRHGMDSESDPSATSGLKDTYTSKEGRGLKRHQIMTAIAALVN